MRVFIAAIIPEEIKIEIDKYLKEIKPNWEWVKWEKYNKLHVTLKFLGEVEESIVERFKSTIQNLVLAYSPFEMAITGFGGFPNLKNPRVLFIGLSENLELLKLHGEIEERLEVLGFKKENRRFVPHVTVGRIKGRSKSRGIFPVPNNTHFFISQIAVMKSELKPEGSKYTPLSVLRLNNKRSNLS